MRQVAQVAAQATAADQHDTSGMLTSRPAALKYHQFQAPCVQKSKLAGKLSAASISASSPLVPTFRNEIAADVSQPSALAAAAQLQQQPQLVKDKAELESKIDKLEERIESLGKLMARATDSRLHNKANELQDELCQRKFDLLVAQLHLAAVKSQLQLFEYNFRPAESQQAIAAAAGIACSNELLSVNAASVSAQQATSSSSTLASVSAVNSNATDLQVSDIMMTSASGVTPVTSSSTSIIQTSNSKKQHLQQNSLASGIVGSKNRWIKAFKSLRDSPTNNENQNQRLVVIYFYNNMRNEIKKS